MEYTDDIYIAVQESYDYLEDSNPNDVARFLEEVAESILDVDSDVIKQVAQALRDIEEGI